MASYSQNVDYPTVLKWVEQCHATTAKLDMDTWLDDFLTPDISVKFFTAPLLEGREQVEPVFKAFCAQLDGLEHDMVHTDYAPPRVYHHCRVRYLPKGGDPEKDTIAADVMAVWHMRESSPTSDGAKALRCYKMEVYGDVSELFSVIKLG